MKPMKFREIEKIILEDGWFLVRVKGSHHQYHHLTKKGTVTLAKHQKECTVFEIIEILKQAGLK